ncbi:cupin domain-containing protein [Streptomyces polygonati]|uniref:Cupin domain-containing protein n=1 Tax=Streptomyces polygonati TaxID=1617087 RepID=A0ABV8HH47_9ACTN
MTDQETDRTNGRDAELTIRALESEHLTRAHGLDLKLLHPWPGLNAPFRGAWCVLRPGDVSEPHAHSEREIFICMSGRATVLAGDTRKEFAAGDIAHLLPGVQHSITNEHDEDFAYYAIWWGEEMAAEFLTTLADAEQSRRDGGRVGETA